MPAHAYAAPSATTPLSPFTFERRAPGPGDVSIDILFCGVCHSDLHTARGEWPGVVYPCVPGHEIVGRVTAVGAEVSRFRPGDAVAIGCLVDSCRHCGPCRRGLEQYCEAGPVGTYGGVEKATGLPTYGGYSDRIVVRQEFVLRVPDSLDLAAAAPLLCAGITTYSPLRHWNAGPGKKVGVVGLGGLGHMGLKFAHSLGAHVVQFTTSENKIADAKKLGADEVVISKDAAAMAKHASSFDFILDCVSAPHDINAYLGLLRLDGALCLVGLPDQPVATSPFALVTNRRSLSGSMIGGMKETQDMLDYCAEKNIVSDIELIGYDRLEEAYTRVVKGDVKYRFVLDNKTLKA